MARFAVGVMFGLVVGVVAGAALGVAAQSSDAEAAEAAPPDDDDGSIKNVTEPEPEPEPGPGVWDRLAQCESTGRWNVNTGNGFSGGLQFDPPTWRRYGGTSYAPAAYLATRAQQITIAERTLATQGWQAWPVCSRIIGMR